MSLLSCRTTVFGVPSKMKAFFQNFFNYLPMPVTEFLQDTLPLNAYKKARANKKVAHRVARELVQSKSADLLSGKANRDVMSILGKLVFRDLRTGWYLRVSAVRANAAETGYAHLSDDEMIAQMRYVIINLRNLN